MLSPKQQRFVDEYLLDLNATQAAIRAGYSEATAQEQSSRLLSNVMVREAIDAALANRSERTQIDADYVLTRLAAEAEADMADIFDPDGALLPVKDWPAIWRKGLVAGVDVELGQDGATVQKVRFSDRIKRLELIGKHVAVQAFQKNIQVNSLDGLADRLSRIKERVDALPDDE